ncbi:hypothetical protein HMPREF0860_1346 [Treponema socranskii subsp. socranskii VPI DR56BR1116 = ATCC 35536]|uniref:Lipoprotein n=1 Tax=Treponema socranskii subsp. socranskii VPI DR56BR1116 = ATCC 35536 TaxID=1125725 RepID=A0ABP2YQU7_TRESO|nr:hypothetical protein HMPREF0860_1346 [Treponema socranskii subsp. socranskii VPI DR56BR1116 = ATCC 35536]
MFRQIRRRKINHAKSFAASAKASHRTTTASATPSYTMR